MGLLDNFDDPKNQGLLALGLGLLNSRGNFGQGLGQAGQQAMGAYGDARRQQQQRAMQKQQMQSQQQAMQMQQAQLAQQQAQAQRQAQAEGARGGYLNSIDPSAGPAQQFSPISAMRAGLNASEIDQLGPKSAPKPLIVGNTVLDPTTMRPLYREPDAPTKDPESIRVLKMIHGEGTPAYAAALGDYGRKMTTHQPAASAVSYGSPVPIMLPDGSIGYAQPGNKSGAAPQVMAGADGRPLVKPGDAEKPPSGHRFKADGTLETIPGGPAAGGKGLTEAQGKATAYLGQMRAAEETLSQLGGAQDTLKGQVGVALARGGANIIAGPKSQQVNQAQEQWAEAFLRFKTGAAATEPEVKRNIATFFPKFGDGKDVVLQKARMREQAMADIGMVAGSGADKAEVVPSIRERSKPAPKVWDLQDGYRFKGGDPGDPKNWEKVK